MLVPNRYGNSGAYRYGFNGKENDNEVIGEGNFQDYGMRMYNPRIGRFFNVDPLTKKFPELTPYQFASNTPIQAIDLDGLEAFYIHGTWSDYSTYPELTKATVNDIFNNTTGKKFEWTGYNTDEYRQIAGRQLAEHIAKNRDPGQALTLVGQSHGGNVTIIAANILKNEYGIEVDNLITINTPVREYELNSKLKTMHYQIFHNGDPVQANGGNDVVIPDKIKVTPIGSIPIYAGGQSLGTGEIGKAGRTFENAINIEVEGFQNWNPTNFHDSHQRPEVFGPKLREIKNKIENPKINLKEKMPTKAIDKTAVKR
jgi:RHS repeat-associated protein